VNIFSPAAADVFSPGLDDGSQMKVTDLNGCKDLLIFDAAAVCGAAQ